jgi:primosomal replication protein N
METYNRICPQCGSKIEYRNKYRKTYSEKHKKVCAKCAYNMRVAKYGNTLEKIHREIKEGKRVNGFLNKKHSEETRKKMKCKKKDMLVFQTPEYKEKMSKLTSGENNPMFGKRVFDIWVEKYGIEEANKREIERKNKISIKTNGKNNPMYNKETPLKSGNGIHGWYKNFYFRSLHELKFILICERFKLKIISAEKIRIKYLSYTGNERTYSPDYIVDNKYLIEIKPKKLHNTPLNSLKFRSAIEYCKEKYLKFKVLDFGIIFQNELDRLILNNIVKLN